MNLTRLKQILQDLGCRTLYVKILSANDNSKNQVYLGGSFEILNVLPVREIINEPAGDWNKERFKAPLSFSWLRTDGTLVPAPSTQLILYPKYPEVRLSGFLKGCADAPSALMTGRIAGRALFMSVSSAGETIALVSAPEDPLTTEFLALGTAPAHGVFTVIEISPEGNAKTSLFAELCRIHSKGWIPSRRLNRFGELVDCNSPNCGGYTLEAELGITPNGYAAPDFMGWEIKQFSVKNFERTTAAVITLMTPEPTHGFYAHQGVEAFLRRYGYEDKRGREDRLNFGGIHKLGERHPQTGMRMVLTGFDSESGKIKNSDGRIILLDNNDEEAASWSYAGLMMHWNKKHNRACYVPSLKKDTGGVCYSYGNRVILGENTDFQLFLREISKGNIYYDPGIKLEQASGAAKSKRRSQFRIKSAHIPNLYNTNSVEDVCAAPPGAP